MHFSSTQRTSFASDSAHLLGGSDADEFPIAETTSGPVRGMNFSGIACFRGIPYAAPTAGKGRFIPPQPLNGFEDVRDAFGFGQIAPQSPSGIGKFTQLIEWDKQHGGMGEDCLNLNVWTPGLGDGRKRPVFVSIHGGNWGHASSNAPGFHGDPLARYGDAMVVTVNHRLGAFGFLHLGDFAGEQFVHSGNVGMLDLVAALRWIRANAVAFGGDPDAVLVFGQSGGGRKISALLAMPEARGLFQRAVIQSGSIGSILTREQADTNARLLLAELGIAPERAATLQDVPMTTLIRAQSRVMATGSRMFMPVCDGTVFPAQLSEPAALACSADVPLIISSTLDESAVSVDDYDLDDAGLVSYAQGRFGDRAGEVLAAFRSAYPNTNPYLLKVRIDTQWDRRSRALRQGETRSLHARAPTWIYRFDAPSPAYNGLFGAVHSIDTSLPFHNPLTTLTAETPDYLRTAMEQLTAIWLSFAKTGDPNNSHIPTWEPYTSEFRTTLLVDRSTRAVRDPDRALRLLRDAIGDSGMRREDEPHRRVADWKNGTR